jgi:hypothetical protein
LVPKPDSRWWLVLVVTALTGCGASGFFFLPWERRAAPAAVPSAEAAVDEAWRRASDVPHVSVFYDALAPYGVWEEERGLGWVWTPSEPGFTPYARGRWVDTEAGPTFLADEPYGWAVAHYGRWFYGDEGGGRWRWVPDTRWGPAWVAWRVGEDYVGWSALPPPGWTRSPPDSAWRFVGARDFIGPSVTERAYRLRDVPWLIASSRPHGHEAPGFVVGPEVRYAGWRARKIRLEGLPPGQVRWVPRWERGEVRRMTRSIRVGPAASERRGRKALVVPPGY